MDWKKKKKGKQAHALFKSDLYFLVSERFKVKFLRLFRMGKGDRGRRIRIGGKKEVTVFQVERCVHNDI